MPPVRVSSPTRGAAKRILAFAVTLLAVVCAWASVHLDAPGSREGTPHSAVGVASVTWDDDDNDPEAVVIPPMDVHSALSDAPVLDVAGTGIVAMDAGIPAVLAGFCRLPASSPPSRPPRALSTPGTFRI